MSDRTPDQWSRGSDLTLCGRARRRIALAWVSAHRHREQLVSGIVIALSFGFIGLGAWVYANDRATTKAARAACERSKRLGDVNRREHVKLGVYSKDDLAYFISTIPKTCP